MTESEWDRCIFPEAMVRFLAATRKASDRKLRLFACACCRRLWHLLADGPCRQAVETAERYADGLATAVELDAARCGATAGVRGSTLFSDAGPPLLAVAWACDRPEEGNRQRPGDRLPPEGILGRAVLGKDKSQAALLRDIFGPPLFRDMSVPFPLLRWAGGKVVKLAEAAYQERSLPSGHLDPARLAVLADALEEAGCRKPALVSHCRQQGTVHVRGCWVVDLLLGRE
jgi:hypothetical protein